MIILLMFSGLISGIAFLGRLGLGLLCLFGDNDGGLEADRRQAKKDWLNSMTPEDRAAYFLHERRKKQYVRLRRKVFNEVRKRRVKAFKETGEDKPWVVASKLWTEWDMESWNDIAKAPDAPSILEPWDGGNMEDVIHPRTAAERSGWAPPRWR